jgi:hypothetical protein
MSAAMNERNCVVPVARVDEDMLPWWREPSTALIAVIFCVPSIVQWMTPIRTCPFRAATGMDCAACGATRALGCRGPWAIDQNLLAVLAVVAGGPLLLGLLLSRPFGRWAAGIGWIRDPSGSAVVLLVVWTVMRNLPCLSWFAAGLSRSN